MDWTVKGIGTPEEEALEIVGFYTVMNFDASSSKFGLFVNSAVSRVASACRVETYNIPTTGRLLGAPVLITNFTMAAPVGGGNDLPTEVAICTSLAATGTGDIAPGRRKGRTFLGPFNTAAGTGRPAPIFRASIAANTKILNENLGEIGSSLGVWSRANEEVYTVDRGWVDDAFDIQRRRGVSPTTRTTWNV